MLKVLEIKRKISPQFRHLLDRFYDFLQEFATEILVNIASNVKLLNL